MFDTPNGGFFYSYIVVLGHYSRVILCLVFGVCWNLSQSLWKHSQSLQEWWKSTYMIGPIWYYICTWCQHRPSWAIIHHSSSSTWLCSLVWLLCVHVKSLTISERMNYLLVREDHGKDFHTWHECCSCDIICKWIITFYIHSGARCESIYA